MSGGSFNYAYCHVEHFANELESCLAETEFEPATMTKLREIVAIARTTAALMKEAEWLFSYDTSDDSFMERVREIEK